MEPYGALWGPFGASFAMQNIHPEHAQTPSSMEPYGTLLGCAKHTPTARPHPDPYGALWGFIWLYETYTRPHPVGITKNTPIPQSFSHKKTYAQTKPRPQVSWRPEDFHLLYKTYTHNKPRSRALWSLMGFHLAMKTTHPDHTQAPPPPNPWSLMGCPLARQTMHPGPMEPYGALWSPVGYYLATQNIYPNHTKAPSAMEP